MPVVKILIADDHSLFRSGLVALFALRNDFKVVAEAVNGADAVEKSRSCDPDVILMDVRMPLMDGIEALRMIHAQQPRVRVVMLTASDSDEHLTRAMQAGAAGYLLKSLHPSELFRQLTRILSEDAAKPQAGQRTKRRIRPRPSLS